MGLSSSRAMLAKLTGVSSGIFLICCALVVQGVSSADRCHKCCDLDSCCTFDSPPGMRKWEKIRTPPDISIKVVLDEGENSTLKFTNLFQSHAPSCLVLNFRHGPLKNITTGVRSVGVADISYTSDGSQSRVPLEGNVQDFNVVRIPIDKSDFFLEWDEQIAGFAQDLANTCRFGYDISACEVTESTYCGQNIFAWSGSTEDMPEADWEHTLKDWFDEMNKFDPSDLQSYKYSSKNAQFTQTIWAESDKVGCAFAGYIQDGWSNHFYVCNYHKPGNFIANTVYKEGEPCSECPDGKKCSQTYEGLCGKT